MRRGLLLLLALSVASQGCLAQPPTAPTPPEPTGAPEPPAAAAMAPGDAAEPEATPEATPATAAADAAAAAPERPAAATAAPEARGDEAPDARDDAAPAAGPDEDAPRDDAPAPEAAPEREDAAEPEAPEPREAAPEPETPEDEPPVAEDDAPPETTEAPAAPDARPTLVYRQHRAAAPTGEHTERLDWVALPPGATRLWFNVTFVADDARPLSELRVELLAPTGGARATCDWPAPCAHVVDAPEGGAWRVSWAGEADLGASANVTLLHPGLHAPSGTLKVYQESRTADTSPQRVLQDVVTVLPGYQRLHIVTSAAEIPSPLLTQPKVEVYTPSRALAFTCDYRHDAWCDTYVLVTEPGDWLVTYARSHARMSVRVDAHV